MTRIQRCAQTHAHEEHSMIFDTRAFGADLRAWRHRHRKSLSNVAATIGLSRSHLARIETGAAQRIGVDIAMRIARIVGADLESYLRDTMRTE
jgi:transcriptional regulator with XRE-family HTH domain